MLFVPFSFFLSSPSSAFRREYACGEHGEMEKIEDMYSTVARHFPLPCSSPHPCVFRVYLVCMYLYACVCEREWVRFNACVFFFSLLDPPPPPPFSLRIYVCVFHSTSPIFIRPFPPAPLSPSLPLYLPPSLPFCSSPSFCRSFFVAEKCFFFLTDRISSRQTAPSPRG